jgi:hypothetical protein
MWCKLKDDPCAYQRSLTESTSQLNYVLDPSKYYNCNPCRIESNIVAGNDVSIYKGNMVDLESELRGQTRKASKCPDLQFKQGTFIQDVDKGNCPDTCLNKRAGLSCDGTICKKRFVHLPECRIIDTRPKIANTGIHLDFPKCPNMPLQPNYKRKTNIAKPTLYWQGQQGIDLK